VEKKITEDTLRQQLSDATRMMVMADLLDFSGHLSARIPGTDRVLIQPRDASRAGLTPEEIVVVDLQGTLLSGNVVPPTETEIHLGVYRARPDVGAIAHGHPPMAILFSMVDRPMVAMRIFGFRFVDMPIHPDPTHIRTTEQGDAVAKTLGSGRYCLLRGHGSVVAAETVPEIFLDSLEMEDNARANVMASTLGPIKPFNAEEIEMLRPSFKRNTYRIEKTWEHYKEKARRQGVL
jgi:ribulose-5-phosphate 4-epimerase/fuculose-1-phosphate aldolase